MTPAPLLTWKGRRVRSPGDTPETAAGKVPPPPLRPGSLFFVPSPLEGWGLDVLLARLPAEAAVVLMEKDDELRDRCRSAFSDFLGAFHHDPRLHWLEADSEAAVQALFARLPLAQLRRCEFLTLNGAWISHAARYREVFARLESGLTRWWSNRLTSIHLGPLWVRNLFDNLSSIPEFTPWPDWGDRPILVCGAGVTLEQALFQLLPQRDDWRILAADTALPVLKDFGVRPDGVVSLEAQHANLRDFAGWRGSNVPLFADLTSYPPATRVFGSAPYWFVSEFAELQWWDRFPWSIPRLPPLGSVGVAAAAIAWRLTRGPVVFAGLDFSFPRGRTHARGAPALTALAASTDRLHPMEQTGSWPRHGVQGVASGWLTTPVLQAYAGVLADQARTEATRTFVAHPGGLPLGLELWRGVAARGPLVTPSTKPVQGPPPRDWLRAERARWQALCDAFTHLNTTPDDRQAWEDLRVGLREVDYLTFSFPDPDFRPASDWLIRALKQLEWILARTANDEA